MKKPFVRNKDKPLEKKASWITYFKLFLLVILIGLASWVRFREFGKLCLFTYDQARDAFYIKRIIVDHQLRLIGTQSSIPGLYTGPFYYYLMAPFLALFKLNPVGIDFATIIFSLVSVVLLFQLLLETTQSFSLTYLISFLFAFSPQIVLQSRFAWNPNLLPLFTLLMLFSLKRIIFDKKEEYLILLAFSLGAAINLHYSGLALILSLFLVLIFFRPRFLKKKFLLASFLVLFLFFLPLLLFDLRHGFTNLKNIFKYFSYGIQGGIPPLPFWPGIWEKIEGLFSLFYKFSGSAAKIWAVILVILGFWYFIAEGRKRTYFSVVFLTFLGGAIFSALYKGSFFFFYLTFLYPVPFLLVGLMFKKLFNRRLLALIFLGFIIGIIFVKDTKATRSYSCDRTFKDVKSVAKFLSTKIKSGEKFNLVSIYGGSERFGHNAVDYRYFLETYEKITVPGWDVLDYQEAKVIYLISEIGEVDPLKAGIWELELFKPQKIAGSWSLSAKTSIYKLEK